jgi:hypothetical protein
MAKKGKVKAQYEDEAPEDRPVRYRRYKYLFLIVCEDGKTEPEYFRRFKADIPENTIFLKAVGTGRDPLGVMEQAVAEREILSIASKKEVDVVWVVFDTDDAAQNATKIQRFSDAFVIAAANKIKVAYSNESFELWLLLHLTDLVHNVALPRADIYAQLEAIIRRHPDHTDFTYVHGEIEILDIIETIGDQAAAITRAEVLLQKHGVRLPINANPSTAVHLLVQELLGWIIYFSYVPE